MIQLDEYLENMIYEIKFNESCLKVYFEKQIDKLGKNQEAYSKFIIALSYLIDLEFIEVVIDNMQVERVSILSNLNKYIHLQKMSGDRFNEVMNLLQNAGSQYCIPNILPYSFECKGNSVIGWKVIDDVEWHIKISAYNMMDLIKCYKYIDREMLKLGYASNNFIEDFVDSKKYIKVTYLLNLH